MAQWWDEWELRILVLASLVAQYFLVVFAGVRKFHIPPWLRASFRLAQIGSDALAIFALAKLVNCQNNGSGCSHARGSRDLELLWAPILVMHLGGQVVITTYKIEDNEQWSRHILTSLSKVTVAIYMFYKSWSSNDKWLLASIILLFFLVSARCLQKALDLKSSSFNALQKASLSEVIRATPENTQQDQFEIYIEQAKSFMNRRKDPQGDSSREMVRTGAIGYIQLPYQLFLDFPCPYAERLDTLRLFWLLQPDSVFLSIEAALTAITNFLYTKDSGYSLPHLLLRNVPGLRLIRSQRLHIAISTLNLIICFLFYSISTVSVKEAYGNEDTSVTLVLLFGTLLLELVYYYVQSTFQDKFSGRILQHSLIGLLVQHRRYPKLRSIAEWLQCKDLLDVYFWHMEPSYSCKEITELVRLHVESGWNDYIRDSESYKRFNDTRGEWTLARKGCTSGLLESSLRRPFDESILLWHLATDLCFHQADTSPDGQQCARQCKEMSNYMMHLLFENPEMLMPGSRNCLFARAYKEIEDIVNGQETSRDEREFTREIIGKFNAGLIGDSFIRDSWQIAGTLLDHSGHNDETKMWELIQGVWLEMLCFSAGRCRGYLHAETLGTGVEYLSYVWILLTTAGMETFQEKLVKREGMLYCREGGSAENRSSSAT